jgi:apolipoprotein N-acyltransferase
VAWGALTPLLVALGRTPTPPGRRAFALGLVTGSVYFAVTMYWTPRVMSTYGDINVVVSILLGSLLVAYLALFPALFAVLQGRVCRMLGPSGLWLAPALWVTTELLRGWILSGFPWVLLGYSQAPVIPVIQLASVTGVYGVSALVALASVCLAFGAVGRSRERFVVPVAGAVAIVVVAGLGQWRVSHGDLTSQGDTIRVALVQGNIRQEQKWDSHQALRILDTYLSMTRDAAARGARLVLWPESATPFYFEYDPAGNAAIRSVVRQTGIHLLFGSDQYQPGPPPRWFNSAFMLDPTGATTAVYRKMHLVPFGEYVPLKRLLFFAGPLVQAVSDFSPGDEAVVMSVGTHTMSTAICYEVVYPGLIGAFTSGGSQLLSTITNDAWYGRTSATYQHFWQASVRAVEQGRYLIRAANTGISGIIDPYGRVLARSLIFNRTTIVGDVRFISRPTIYGRTGDVFAYACLLLTALAAALTFRGRGRPDAPWASRRRRASR